MKKDFLNDTFYEYLLLDSLSTVYSAIKKEEKIGNDRYACLLIDKFAIHSASFFHLSQGIIEHRNSGEKIKSKGFDLFTVNSTFRAIIETYATFHHLFVSTESKDEKEFKLLIWKLDGLNERQKCIIDESAPKEIKELLKNNERIIESLKNDIISTEFYRNNRESEILKVFNPEKNKYCWRFYVEAHKIKPMTIMRLVEKTLKTSGFQNSYRHCSTHTHSSYLSIEEFERFRGKPIPDSYTRPLIKLAIFITCMIIDDITKIDINAENKFAAMRYEVKYFIKGMSDNIKNASH